MLRETGSGLAAGPLPSAAPLRRRLLSWYRSRARDLPWRSSRDPYSVWVSEIMLQQTQVATVIGYYTRFMKRFPTLAALARADEAEVLRHWEGLGYYRRARQLHAAARRVVADHGGQIPRDPGRLRELPGIGRYTAGAILSIAFDERQPILEANTIRLVSRLLGYRGPVHHARGQEVLWEAAARWLPRRNVGVFNQALMELGSLVCVPQQPNCACCPLTALCVAHRQQAQAEIPVAAPAPRIEAVGEVAVVLARGREILVRRLGPGRRWAGLWDFPRFSVTSPAAEATPTEIAARLAEEAGIEAKIGRHLTTLKHAVTRYRITLACYRAEYRRGDPGGKGGEPWEWIAPERLEALPLSVTGRKLARIVLDDCPVHAPRKRVDNAPRRFAPRPAARRMPR